MLSFGANVKIVSSGGNVIIWCYHVMLPAGMITHPFFNFPENFSHSKFFHDDILGRLGSNLVFIIPFGIL
jgi:hypothetical protein